VTGASRDQLARVVRQHAGQLAASLMHETGDFAAAEDMVQDAVLAALQHWPEEGIPRRPDAWLFTVARRRGLDMMRRQANYRVKLAQLRRPVQPAPDDRLRLIFTWCHPALTRPAQIALNLRVVWPDHRPDRPRVPAIGRTRRPSRPEWLQAPVP